MAGGATALEYGCGRGSHWRGVLGGGLAQERGPQAQMEGAVGLTHVAALVRWLRSLPLAPLRHAQLGLGAASGLPGCLLRVVRRRFSLCAARLFCIPRAVQVLGVPAALQCSVKTPCLHLAS